MSKKIKVLHIIYDLSLAGAQTVVMSYLRGTNSNPEYEFAALVTEGNKGTLYDLEANEKGYKVLYSDYHPVKKIPVIRSFINWIRYQKCIKKSIETYMPEIVHVHGTKLLTYSIIPIALCKIKKRFHTLHSDPYAVPNRYIPMAKLAFNQFGFHPICVTETQAIKAKKRYGLKEVSIIPNGLDLSKYCIQEDKSEIRKSLAIEEDSFVLGFVGRLDANKNVGFLLKVFRRLHECRSNSILLIVGEGEKKSELIETCHRYGIENNVRFLGVRNDTERIFKAMDVFSLVSFFESSSIVTVEAQLSGIKVVIADTIPENVIISDLVSRLSLNDSIENWVNSIMSDESSSKCHANVIDFDIIESLNKLFKLYNE